LTKYRELRRQGRAPKEIELNGTIIISAEAEREWERRQEQPTGRLAKLVAQEAAMRKKRAKAGAAARRAKQLPRKP
jgi:hypothetical protein